MMLAEGIQLIGQAGKLCRNIMERSGVAALLGLFKTLVQLVKEQFERVSFYISHEHRHVGRGRLEG